MVAKVNSINNFAQVSDRIYFRCTGLPLLNIYFTVIYIINLSRDPTPLRTSLVPVVWQPVRAQDDALDIQTVQGLVYGKTLKMSQQLANERIVFWDQIYRIFYRKHVLLFDEK